MTLESSHGSWKLYLDFASFSKIVGYWVVGVRAYHLGEMLV